MTLEQILLLSFIQGMTEFLPVSSSGHLVLVPALSGWEDQGILMDVAAHVGTLGAVLVYFYKDVIALIKGFFSFLRGRYTEDTRLLFNLMIATIPVVLIGFLFEKMVGDTLRSATVIAWTGIVFGLILYGADRYGRFFETIPQTNAKRAFYFGFAQCLALVNGVSRSGACLTIGRLMNYKRTEAARFAFLMSIPTLAAAGVLKGYHLIQLNNYAMIGDATKIMFFSFLFGLGAITFMMRWLQSHTLTPFVVYRVLLGVFLLIIIYSGWLV